MNQYVEFRTPRLNCNHKFVKYQDRRSFISHAAISFAATQLGIIPQAFADAIVEVDGY